MSKNSNRSRVKVFVRTRPTSNFATEVIDLDTRSNTINIHTKKNEKHKVVNNQLLDWAFKVDGILHNASQEQIYAQTTTEMVRKAVLGYNGTLLAYGQTGAGKTFTITGATENFQQRGVIPRAISQVFKEIDEQSENMITVRISYLEIYNENMYDLLATYSEGTQPSVYDNHLTIVENTNGSINIRGLSLHTAHTEEEALNLLFEGETNRIIAAHCLNKNSSRSHCIFTIHFESRSRTQSNAKYVTSKLNFVDLAGSERLKKTGSEGQIQREAKYINKSLTFLEQTVIALTDKRREHIPFRQTKLTHCLKDSIGGNCITTMIANIYGESGQIEETISTLRFALRMMCVAVEPAVNNHYDPWLLVHDMQSEIKHLKQELTMHATLANKEAMSYDSLTEGQLVDIRKQVRHFLERKTSDIEVENLRQIHAVFNQFRSVAEDMEDDIESRFRQNYVLLDKKDSEMMTGLQKIGFSLDEDGNYFHTGESVVAISTTGPTDTSSKSKTHAAAAAAAAPVVANIPIKRKSGKKSRAGGSPVGRGSPQVDKPSKGVPTDSGESVKKEGSVVSAESIIEEKPPTSRPSTPPPRSTSFEEFKKEKGREINKILIDNKTILASKKKMVRDLSHAINATKQMIDDARQALSIKRQERIEQGEFVSEEGDTVIEEDEFILLSELKKLKQQYRNDYDELRSLRSELQYCQKLVEKSRNKLLQEFDTWYNECFLLEPETSVAAGFGGRLGLHPPSRLTTREAHMGDEHERFHNLQQNIFLENEDSASFFNAKIRTQRKQTYERALRQPQPSQRKPLPQGVTGMAVVNKPPSQLHAY